MTDQEHEQALTEQELKEQNGEPLPDREAMSLITPPVGVDGIGTIAPVEPSSDA